MTSRRLLPWLAALFALSGCATNFVTRKREFKLISEKTEIEIGRKAKQDIIKEYGVYKDLDWQIYLDQVGQKLAKNSDRPNLPYDFTIIDSDMMNAFAVPGGFVFVTRGILLEMSDEAELSIVVGHEITHIAAWHGVEMLQKAGLLSTLTTLGTIGGVAMGAGQAAIALGQAANIYQNLYLLGYGRSKELEADRYGILYAARAGYDPEAAYTFFKKLQKVEKEEEAGQRISPYWRTHPSTDDRLKRVQKWIAQIPPDVAAKATEYNRDKYQALVAKLPQVEPAERGVVQGRRYTNIPFKLKLEVPDGWSMDNSRVQTLVNFHGPVPEVRGNLQRVRLPQEMGAQEFGQLTAKQIGLHEVTSRTVDYPAGHGLLWQYGGDYVRYRSLLLVRDQAGYILTCQTPSDVYLEYLVECERIMRSLTIE